MYITLNFILLFLVIVLPGIVFRRFYYYGEFSKQFRIKEPLHHLFISNIIPGVVLLLLSVLFLRRLEWISPLTDLYPKIYASVNDFTIDDSFLKNISVIAGTTFLLAFMLGWSLSRLLRLLRLDVRYKFLRYKNGWYYLFSGEISNFDKFKSNLPLKKEIKKRKKFYPPLVDILVGQGDNTILYSGILLDYEISQNDLLGLERVYLKEAQRYHKEEDKTKPVDIPGNLFVLNTQNLLNININYPKDLGNEQQKGKTNLYRFYDVLLVFFGLFTLSIILVFIYSLFFTIDWAFYDTHKWYGKLILLFFILNFVSLLIPTKKENETTTYSWENKYVNIVWVIILTIIYFIIHWPF